MSRFVGYEHSDFDATRYEKSVGDNCGNPLTTEDIRKGIAAVARDIDANPNNNWLAEMKTSQCYISPRHEEH
jgi:hypothetical protein